MDWIKTDLAGGAGASNLVFNEKIKKLRVSFLNKKDEVQRDRNVASACTDIVVFLGARRSNSPFGFWPVSLSAAPVGR